MIIKGKNSIYKWYPVKVMKIGAILLHENMKQTEKQKEKEIY